MSLKKDIKVNTLSYIEAGNQLKVDITCDVEFKMYLYYTEPFSNSQTCQNLANHYDVKITAHELNVKNLQQRISAAYDEIKKLETEDEERRKMKIIISEKISNLENQIKDFKESIIIEEQQQAEKVKEGLAFYEGLNKEGILDTAKQIVKIFNDNNLNSNAKKCIQNIDLVFNEKKNKVKSYTT